MAGEISERMGDTKAAVEYYAKGNNYARAVQLAREVSVCTVNSGTSIDILHRITPKDIFL